MSRYNLTVSGDKQQAEKNPKNWVTLRFVFTEDGKARFICPQIERNQNELSNVNHNFNGIAGMFNPVDLHQFLN